MSKDGEERVADVARERASEKARQISPPQEKQEQAPIPKTASAGLTTREELLSAYRTTIVRTTSGNAFEIRAISPGDFLLYLGSPMLKALADSGIDVGEPGAVSQAVADMSTGEAVDVITKGDLVELARRNVCAGVISLNFVMKPQGECDDSKQETSVFLLSVIDAVDLYTAIVHFSVGDEDVDMVQTFRGEGEEKQVGPDTDTSTGDGV